MGIQEELFFTKEHLWIAINRKKARLGLTAYACSKLGEIIFIDFPKLNSRVKKDNLLLAVESSKAVSEVNSPFDGRVADINEKLKKNPGLINEKPCPDNWLAEIEMDNENDGTGFMKSGEYEKYIKAGK